MLVAAAMVKTLGQMNKEPLDGGVIDPKGNPAKKINSKSPHNVTLLFCCWQAKKWIISKY